MGKRLRRVLKWTAIAISLVVVLAFLALAVAYFRSDNDCAERAATPPANPMKAIVYCDYGAPEVLKLETVEKPVPPDDQMLIKVRAASINPLEMHYMRGTPYVARLQVGLRRPKSTRLGVDYSGTVEAVGKNIKSFKPGDHVFGGRNGALAEYVVATERLVVPKPDNVTFEQAGTVAVAGLTALQAIRDKGRVKPGQRVLINGASGGVGTFTVQIAKSLGAHATGVCSTRNVDLVRSLGADAVIDYTKQDYTQAAERYDVIVDMVGNHSLSANRRVLKPDGIYVIVGGPKGKWIAPVDRFLKASVMDRFVGQELVTMFARLNREDLTVMADLMAAGKVRPVVDRTYPLSEVPEAMRYLETGRARGKVVIEVGE